MKGRLISLLAGLLLLALGASAQGAACDRMQQRADIPDSRLRLCWSVVDEQLRMVAVYPGSTWIGVGWGQRMQGADAVIGRPDAGSVTDSYITGRRLEDILADKRSDIVDSSLNVEHGFTTMAFTRPLDTGDGEDVRLTPQGWTTLLWASGDGRSFRRHRHYGVIDINLATGEVRRPGTAWVLLIHGGIMLLAWGVVAPVVALVARFCKVAKGQGFPRRLDNRFWWCAHLYGNTAVVVLSWLAVALLWVSFNGPAIDSVHETVGMLVLCLGIWQLCWGIGRGTKGGPTGKGADPLNPETWRGDHYDMTPRRRVFETVHKTSGYLVLLLTVLTVFSGLIELKAGWAWMLAYAAWILVYLLLFRVFSLKGARVDTYQAIWGLDKRHPGNR